MESYLPALMSELENARKDAVRILCQAQVQERLSVDAFETRLDQVRQAPNRATLEAIIADLEPTTTQAAIVPTAYSRYPVPADHVEMAPVSPAEFVRVASVFASTKRAGSWTVPLEIHGRVLFGEMTLDLKDAIFASDVVDIDVDVMLGSFTLILPAGTQVENEVHEVLSSSSHSTRSSRGVPLNGLLVRLRGRVMLGSVEVKEKQPSALAGGGSIWERLLRRGE
jgi:hypothetical protein